MTDKEVQEFIEENAKRGSILGLESVRELASRMGNPEQATKVLHIAGTNGKGSILAYLSTILEKAGYVVGRYISPVITQYREKIQVNQKMISKKALAEGLEHIKACMEQMEAEGLALPTLFEIETVLAFWYFKEKKCDFVVLETGMGGETDATNIVEDPLLCIFASISMDHMGFLGDTIEEIAAVKAGIMRSNAQVVSVWQRPEVKLVLDQKASALGCNVVYAERGKNQKSSLNGQSFDYKQWKKCKINLLGTWQPENACAVLEAINSLRNIGYDIPDRAVYEGLSDTKWLGRFTVLQKKPLFIVDGAHNEDAARRLRETILEYVPDKPLIFIIGVLKDKEYEKVLSYTADLASQIITITPPENPRALNAYELAAVARNYCPSVTNADSLEEATEMAKLLAGQDCAIIAFGSLSYLGRLSEIVEKKGK